MNLGYKNIYVFDKKIDRINYAVDKYKVNGTKDFIDIIKKSIDAIIISTSPESHSKYIKISLDFNIPCFRGFVTDKEYLKELSEIAQQKNIFVAPFVLKTVILSKSH